MRWHRTPLRLEEAGPASVDEVWRRYTTPALWAGWAPQIRDVDHPIGRIAPDGRGIVRGPLGLRVPFVVEAVDAVPHPDPLLYARVDAVRLLEGGWGIMELELIEPSLYFPFAPGSAARFAAALDAVGR